MPPCNMRFFGSGFCKNTSSSLSGNVDSDPLSYKSSPSSNVDRRPLSDGNPPQPPSSNKHRDPVRLVTFPIELLLQIIKSYSPSSVLALSYTCKYFYYSCGFSLDDVLDPNQSISSRDLTCSERLKLLSMLERDRQFPGGKLFCSACATTYSFSLFPMRASRSPPRKRNCRGSERKIWMCPDNVLDYDQVQGAEEYFKQTNS